MGETDPTLDRLEDQINWYGRRSGYNRRMYKWLKGVEIVAAALVPLAAGFHFPAALTGSLGVLIAVLEGLLQLNQYLQNGISYRSTCEALKHEKYLYLASAGPYATDDRAHAHAKLAERVESLVSQENSQWTAVQERQAQPKEAGS
ncbi:MAG: DUF4231 domain-containing protein [Terriglobia bacterium]|jgi:hypothetical protein